MKIVLDTNIVVSGLLQLPAREAQRMHSGFAGCFHGALAKVAA
jgi:hypothetical protein